MDFASMEDAALLTIIAGKYGVQTADPALNEAVGVLYDRYGRLVYSIAIHVVGDVETAEEITQDVFVRACEGAGSYRAEVAKVSSWLVSIARNRAIDELRRRGARPEKNRADWPEDLGQENADGLPVIDGPEDNVALRLEQHTLRQIIAGLPPDQRQVLSLAFFKGLSHSQISAQLGEPLGTVKSRIRLAMHHLRDALVDRGMIDRV